MLYLLHSFYVLTFHFFYDFFWLSDVFLPTDDNLVNIISVAIVEGDWRLDIVIENPIIIIIILEAALAVKSLVIKPLIRVALVSYVSSVLEIRIIVIVVAIKIGPAIILLVVDISPSLNKRSCTEFTFMLD